MTSDMRVGIEACDPALDQIVIAASRTTNCLAWVLKAVQKNLRIRHTQISGLRPDVFRPTITHRAALRVAARELL